MNFTRSSSTRGYRNLTSIDGGTRSDELDERMLKRGTDFYVEKNREIHVLRFASSFFFTFFTSRTGPLDERIKRCSKNLEEVS